MHGCIIKVNENLAIVYLTLHKVHIAKRIMNWIHCKELHKSNNFTRNFSVLVL